MNYKDEIKSLINKVPKDYYNYGDNVTEHILSIKLQSGRTSQQVLDSADGMKQGDKLVIINGDKIKRPDMILSEDKNG